MGKIIAIMQPTYIPWLGYLAMIEKVDQFVFLDNVQFEHRSWQQRNRIKTDKGELWFTISVKKKNLFEQKINQVVCVDIIKDVNKQLKSLKHYYAKSSFFKNFFNDFALFVNIAQTESKGFLSAFNIKIINFLCRYAGIEKEFILSSQINVSGQKDELLANISEYLGAKTYLAAPGSKSYLEKSKFFEERDIKIIYHDYSHPSYFQLYGDFIEGMSCIDAFFNVKQEKLKSLIMSGCK
jgi:hypothetical protein